MLSMMSANWWVILLRGIAGIIFGVIAIINPAIAIEALITVFAVYALVDGVLTIIAAISHRDQPRWWAVLLEGIFGVIAGVGALLFPILALTLGINLIAFWAILTGIFQIIAAIQLRKEIEGEFFMGLAGAISIIFGVLLLVFPVWGAITLITIVGVSSIIFGIMLALLAFRVRGKGDTMTAARA
jgi:uncharacterized membrane protein HdeD (DUF308 family)